MNVADIRIKISYSFTIQAYLFEYYDAEHIRIS